MNPENIIPIIVDGNHVNRRSYELVHERLENGMKEIQWPESTGETMQQSNARIQAEVLRSGASNIPAGYTSDGEIKI